MKNRLTIDWSTIKRRDLIRSGFFRIYIYIKNKWDFDFLVLFVNLLVCQTILQFIYFYTWRESKKKKYSNLFIFLFFFPLFSPICFLKFYLYDVIVPTMMALCLFPLEPLAASVIVWGPVTIYTFVASLLFPSFFSRYSVIHKCNVTYNKPTVSAKKQLI